MSEAEDNDILELDSETEDGDVEMTLMTDVGEFSASLLVFFCCLYSLFFYKTPKKRGHFTFFFAADLLSLSEVISSRIFEIIPHT